jgi:hypothetical protein
MKEKGYMILIKWRPLNYKIIIRDDHIINFMTRKYIYSICRENVTMIENNIDVNKTKLK